MKTSSIKIVKPYKEGNWQSPKQTHITADKEPVGSFNMTGVLTIDK